MCSTVFWWGWRWCCRGCKAQMIGAVLPTLPAELRSFLSPRMSRMGLIIKFCMHLLASAHTGRYFIYRCGQVVLFRWKWNLRLEKLLSAAFQLLELGGRAIICFKASEAIEGKGWMGFCWLLLKLVAGLHCKTLAAAEWGQLVLLEW